MESSQISRRHPECQEGVPGIRYWKISTGERINNRMWEYITDDDES
jgi:hypothetical protein